MTDRRLTFTTAVGVINRVHYGTSYFGSQTKVSCFTCLTKGNEFVVNVTNLTDGRAALQENISHFAAGHTDGCVLAFYCHDLRGNTSATSDLAAFTRGKLDVVYHRTYGDVFKGKCVTYLDVRVRAAHNLVPYVQTYGSEDVRFNAVCVNQERDVSATVGVVLNALYGCGNIVLQSLEIDDTIFSTITAADVSGSNSTRVVSTAAMTLIVHQRAFGFRAGR